MYMKHNEQFKLMMRGGLGQFTQYEVWTILSHQEELGINTLMIQKDPYGQFLCKVDELTIICYKKEYCKICNIPLIEIQYKKNYELKLEDLQLEKLRGV